MDYGLVNPRLPYLLEPINESHQSSRVVVPRVSPSCIPPQLVQTWRTRPMPVNVHFPTSSNASESVNLREDEIFPKPLLREDPAALGLPEEPQIGDFCGFLEMRRLQADTVGAVDHAVVCA